MASHPEKEVHLKLIREYLNLNKVRLWLEPFTKSDGTKGDEPVELCCQGSQDLSIPYELLSEYLEELRLHAIKKLAAKTKFQQSGTAEIMIKFVGAIPDNVDCSSSTKGYFPVEISLQEPGALLIEKVAAIANLSLDKLKLISAGKRLNERDLLVDQNLSNLSKVMAICLDQGGKELQAQDKIRSKVAKTKEAAELLSGRTDGGIDDDEQYYLQIADQSGRSIDMPVEERKALAFAMTLHERGKASLRRKEYGEAMLLLLEADSEFKKCRSSLLESVDNYAILCLDIVWCYLCLKNINELPDAAERLKTCDMCFRKSYGPNLERLALVKGNTANEKTLFMRLHLLQGVVAFHSGFKDEARQLITRAKQEYTLLQVDEESLAQMLGLGFSEREARLSLRSCQGNLQMAVSHAMEKKETRKEIRQQEREASKLKILQAKLGNSLNGEKIDASVFEKLKSMGYGGGAAAEALRLTDGDLNQAIQMLLEHPEFEELPDPTLKLSQSVSDELISQVVSLGFDAQFARVALAQFNGKIDQAVDQLMKSNGSLPQEWIDKFESAHSNFSHSSSSGRSTDASAAGSSSSDEKQKQQKDAVDQLLPDIPDHEEDHLDLALEEEATFLAEYLALIESSKQ